MSLHSTNYIADAATFGQQYKKSEAQRIIILCVLGALLVIALLLDLATGPSGLGLMDVIKGIFAPQSLDQRQAIILWQVRLPDALIALAVGASLGLAGAETQTILNNPLASPFTLGVSAAATLGASIAIVVAPTIPFISSVAVLPIMALLFALASGALILGFMRLVHGGREAIILFGIALVFLCNAITAMFQYVASAEAVQEIVFWTVGNLTRAGWVEVQLVSFCFLLILPLSLRHVWTMTMLRAGEAQAVALGLNINRLRTMTIARVSVLTAFAVCFVGGDWVYRPCRTTYCKARLGRRSPLLVARFCHLWCAGFVPCFLSLQGADPRNCHPVGILTALVGVPMFLALITMRRREL